ncbi:MAG: 2-hydroxyacyl-CoA dehydratase subunit D [Desulfatibacillaceae bacterium]
MEDFLTTTRKLVREGRRIMACAPLYPPVELFTSMGVTPVVPWGISDSYPEVPASDQHLQQYTCSVARRLAQCMLSEAARNFSGLFFYNACDTLRNMPEIIQLTLAESLILAPTFHLHVSQTPRDQTDADAYTREGIEKLVKQVRGAFGVDFSEDAFRETVDMYRKARGLAAQAEELTARGMMPFSRAAELAMEGWRKPVEAHIEDMAAVLGEHKGNRAREDGPGVVVSGILPPPAELTDAMEAAGLRIVANDVALMHRATAHTPAEFDDAAGYYSNFYSNHFPCTTLLHTADRRTDALISMAREAGASGFVFAGEKFCEYEYLEFPYLERRLKDEGFFVLFLEIAMDDAKHLGAHVTRVEAFAELLHGSNARK